MCFGLGSTVTSSGILDDRNTCWVWPKWVSTKPPTANTPTVATGYGS